MSRAREDDWDKRVQESLYVLLCAPKLTSSVISQLLLQCYEAQHVKGGYEAEDRHGYYDRYACRWSLAFEQAAADAWDVLPRRVSAIQQFEEAILVAGRQIQFRFPVIPWKNRVALEAIKSSFVSKWCRVAFQTCLRVMQRFALAHHDPYVWTLLVPYLKE